MPKKGTLSWVQTLNKEEIIAELQERNVQVEEDENFDTLRKKLRELIKRESENPSAKSTLEKSEIQTVNTKDSTVGTPTVAQSAPADEDCNMSDGVKVEFRLYKDDWETFTEQLDQLFIARDIKPEKKAAHLLVRVDSEAFKLIKQLVAPAKINAKSYDQIVEIMNEHLNPKPSEVMERFNFNQARQEATETVAEFTAKLKKLALNCNFKEIEVALRDQFVCGLKDHATKVELFKKSSLTFDEAYKEATARESAEKNATGSLNTGKSFGLKKKRYLL